MSNYNKDPIPGYPYKSAKFKETTTSAVKPRITLQQYRYFVLATALIVLLLSFWFLTRYPKLLLNAANVGTALPGMI
ncbi:MAG: hypothetical protein HRT38_17690 [Alteromonadaceae bacterium]|nr:hypothetical protein [Alteromonadaceae bacterium]